MMNQRHPSEDRNPGSTPQESIGSSTKVGMSEGPVAVVQSGFGILGTGRNVDEAIAETAEYLDVHEEEVTANLVERSPGPGEGETPAFGEVYAVRCTEGLRRAHEDIGIETPWEEVVLGGEVYAALPSELV
jgi:hypothetical protein